MSTLVTQLVATAVEPTDGGADLYWQNIGSSTSGLVTPLGSFGAWPNPAWARPQHQPAARHPGLSTGANHHVGVHVGVRVGGCVWCMIRPPATLESEAIRPCRWLALRAE
jgi:hypothetical protein